MTVEARPEDLDLLNPDPASATEDVVLFAFLDACPLPSEDEVEGWARRYPKHAPAIAKYAHLALEAAFSRDMTIDDDDSAEADASQEMISSPNLKVLDFPDLVASAGTTIVNLSRELDIDRGVMADLAAGRVRLPIPLKLPRAIASVLGVGVDNVKMALSRSFEQPRLGFANANDAPTSKTSTYAEAIQDSDMAAERKAFWLSVD